MATDLKIYELPILNKPTLIMGFSGWMDGGQVSTGTVESFLVDEDFVSVASIKPDGYYIFNFPGTMEITSMFRPHCIVEDGIVDEFDEPANIFWASPNNNLILFLGHEPNTNWNRFSDCIFEFCAKYDVENIYCLGSVAGLTPHTREPRYSCTVSDIDTKRKLSKIGFKFSSYNGPASLATYLISQGRSRNISIASIVSEIPAYVHGRNPKCIASMAKKISALVGLKLEFQQMRNLGDELEKKLNEIIATRSELSNHILKLEQDYDNEVFDEDMSDLKDWLHNQGIRLD